MSLLPVLMLSLAGPTAWVSALVSAVLVICIGRSVIDFARRYVAVGSLYSYVGEVFGPWARYVTAAALLAGFAAQVAAIGACVGIFGESFLAAMGIDAGGGPLMAAMVPAASITIAAVIAYRGVDTSIRIAVTLAVLSVPLMVVISVVSAAHTGLNLDLQFAPQQFSISGTLQGVAAGAAWLIGFESCTAMAAETREPKRSVPIAVMSVPIILGGLYVICTVLQTPGLLQASAELEEGMSAPAALAVRSGLGTAVATSTDLVLAVACFAALIGFINYGARCILAIGEDGLLPAWTTKVHKEFRSPHLAVITISVAGFLCIGGLLIVTTGIADAYAMVANLIVYCWIPPYVLISIGSVVLLHRTSEVTATALLAAAIGTVGMTWTYLNGWLNPAPPPSDAMRWITVLVIGALAALVFLASRRSVLLESKVPGGGLNSAHMPSSTRLTGSASGC